MLLKFSPHNSKTKRLYEVKELQKWLKSRKFYSCDLLSGWSCPYAKECLSKVYERADGSRYIKDGPDTLFRCFSASQEVIYPPVYNLRKYNLDLLLQSDNIYELISNSIPDNAGIIRPHIGGDFFNQVYFDAWVEIAENHPLILFYAYTKSIPYWNKWEILPPNFILTASMGGRADKLAIINKYRKVNVLADPEIIRQILDSGDHDNHNGLRIDHSDECAAVPEWKDNDFYLLVHGIQPKGSKAGIAKRTLKGVGSYGR